jgi:hypothetical protein
MAYEDESKDQNQNKKSDNLIVGGGSNVTDEQEVDMKNILGYLN